MAQAGPGVNMTKEDLKSVFRNVSMCFQDLNLLGIKVKGQFFIDNCLPFGVSVSCAVFEDISTLIHWIAERRASHAMIHYLDKLFKIHKLFYMCGNIISSFKQVCNEIGMLLLPEKAVDPVQVIQFLGLTINTILLVVKVPEDKRLDILKILTKMIRKRKANSLGLQSLAGKLNFLCKGEVLEDMRMWKSFLYQYKGWQPIISNAK